MPSKFEYDLIPRSSSELSDVEEGNVRHKISPPSRSRVFRKLRRVFRVCRIIYFLGFFILLILCQIWFNASYSDPKPFAVDKRERVFIAANIVNGDLIRGDFGKGLKGLVELIGRDNVFVSVYGSPKDALIELAEGLDCEKSIISEEDEPIDLKNISRTILPTGESKVKRIAFLAEVRNKALEPLQRSEKRFEKVLFINDIVFEPQDAARLLWGTNVNEEGKAKYKAACAADFVSGWKYYDTFATRDAEGHSLGVPIYPWFTTAGGGISRRDVLDGKDAVRVKSCWGGMVAFDAKYFQKQQHSSLERQEGKNETSITGQTLPVRFRFEQEPFWDASECCLIHADIMAASPFSTSLSRSSTDKYDNGIYMNPFVRVAYDRATYRHVAIWQRFERLMTIPHDVISHFAHMPYHNRRRIEREGEVVKDRRWVPFPEDSTSSPEDHKNSEFGGEDESWQGSGVERREAVGKAKDKEHWESIGFYEDFERVARRGGYCGTRQLLVIDEERRGTDVNWNTLLDKVPPIG